MPEYNDDGQKRLPTFRLHIEDPSNAEIKPLLRAGEDYDTFLYPTENNHLLSVNELSASNVKFVVMRNSADVAIGTGALVLNDGWAEIKRLWLDPSERGKGLARMLLLDLEDRAKSAGVFLLRLETGPRHTVALALYNKVGFRPCNRFGGYAPDSNSVFMEKHLRPVTPLQFAVE